MCYEIDELATRYESEVRNLFATAHRFSDDRWESWSPPVSVEPVLLYWYVIPLGATADVAGDHEVFAAGEMREYGVVDDFRVYPGFLWTCDSADKVRTASSAAQALVLRLLAAVPPGKARFTFIDPLGSGSNAAPFLGLADWDPNLIDSKAWCLSGEIASKLAELNTHLEVVIQRYLGGRFDSIEEYNAAAGEVAEPYRFIVIFDFPAQFDEQTLHLLERLVKNGPRCGVYVLLIHNRNQEPPYGADLDPMLAGLYDMPTTVNRAAVPRRIPLPLLRFGGDNNSVYIDADSLKYRDRAKGPVSDETLGLVRRFRTWETPPSDDRSGHDQESVSWLRVDGLSFADAPPELRFERGTEFPGLFTRVLTAVGEQGRGADEVVVSALQVQQLLADAIDDAARSDLPQMLRVASLDDVASWWTGVSAESLAVPIGRSGAKDVAMFKVDTAILSGGLVIGRPGSGKSTLFHSIICGAAVLYSPEEVELYLLDFKQGVEFLGYGEIGLPHARCVAVESEREFGVAILESVAEELERRARMFKEAGPGISDIGAWRSATGAGLSRILIVIDEFQELLNRADRIAGRSAELLDNLIRQGRAFGIHLLLGSQSLSSIDAAGTGITSLLRLLPIRVVLPSDASDAALALGDGNDGARYLTRQGEGIYNAAGGNPERNVPFQGTFLNSDQRHAVVGAARARADAEGFERLPRVFNGQVSATIDSDPADFVARARSGEDSRLWIPVGGSLTLAPDMSFEIRREVGSNVAFICRDEDLVEGFGSVAVTALAAQLAPRGGELRFVDCTPVDSPTDLWLSPLLSTGVVSVSNRRALPSVLAEARNLTDERIDNDRTDAPPVVLVIWGVHRARDLDGDDGGFGMAGFGEENTPAADLERIVRDGPEFGVHTIIWGDSLASTGRRLTARVLREFSWRIAGRLNDADSDRLEVRATELRPKQLACANIEEDRHWKLRGYSPPDIGWIERAASVI